MKYQLIQHTLERCEMRLLTVDRHAYQRMIGGILTDLRHLLGESVLLESAYHERLETQTAGKHRTLLSLCTTGVE